MSWINIGSMSLMLVMIGFNLGCSFTFKCSGKDENSKIHFYVSILLLLLLLVQIFASILLNG